MTKRRLIPLWIFLASASGALAAGGQIQANIGTSANSFTLCTGPCAVLDVQAIASAAVFIYVFDAATLPANGTVGASAKVAFPVASGAMGSYVWPVGEPAIFLNGAVIGCSSAVPPTFTATTACTFFGRANQ
jgi:hypothetical protein